MRSQGTGPSGGGLAGLLESINPKETAAQVVQCVTTWTSVAVSHCFSCMRRSQFDEEHQRSLLSCHTTEDDSVGHFPDEDAMMELRRRVQKVDLHAHNKPMSFAQELELTYHRHKAQQQQQDAVRVGRREKAASADAVLHANATDPTEISLLPSETEQALNAILGTTSHEMYRASDPGRADDLRRLSVDELLALRVLSPVETVDPEVDDPATISEDGRVLREWLEAIDATRAGEFVAYARSFEKQGFHSLADLAQLDENDVEQAMSEVGIAKFAHRARIRKSILRLRHDGPSLAVAAQPALAG